MDTFVLFLLTVANVGIVGTYFFLLRKRPLWLLPLTIFLPQYFLNYVVRAWFILDTESRYSITNADILLSLVYSTLFMAIHVPVLVLLLNRVTFKRPEVPSNTMGFPSLSLILPMCLIFLELGYRISTGNFRGILQPVTRISEQTFVDRLTQAVGPIRWYIVGVCLILLASRTRQMLASSGLILTVGFAALIAFITTAKGMMANCVLTYFMWASVAQRKTSRIAIAAGIGLFIAFGVFSYIARSVDYKLGQVDNVFDYVQRTWNIVMSERERRQDRAMDSLMSRFSYLDGLASMMRSGSRLETGDFPWGSLNEVSNLIPRVLMPNKENLVFERHLTLAVYGFYSPNAAMPVGRIGESYFVAGWLGLLYAPLLAFILWALYHFLWHTRQSVFFRSFYIMLLILSLNHDGALMANMSAHLYVFLVAGSAHVFSVFVSGRSRDEQLTRVDAYAAG